MRRVFMIIGTLILLTGVGVGVLAYQGKSVDHQSMRWGAHVRTYALETPASHDTFNVAANISDQITVAKQLGLTTLRIDLERDITVTKQALQLIKDAGLETVLIVDQEGKDWQSTTFDFAGLGRELGDKAGRELTGLVDVWQVANEVTGSAVQHGDDSPEKITGRYKLSFNRTRYENVRDYTRAMGEAIRLHDPKTPIMLTGHWVLFDVFPMLERDGVPFDIIGWNWYSDQGTNPANRVIDEGGALNLPEEAAKLGKEFWLAEVNYESGSFEGRETKQAQWVTDLGTSIGANPKVKGMIFHMLIDKADEFMVNHPTGYLGLVQVNILPNRFAEVGDPKPVFSTYQKVIQQHPVVGTPGPRPQLDSYRLQLYRALTNR